MLRSLTSILPQHLHLTINQINVIYWLKVSYYVEKNICMYMHDRHSVSLYIDVMAVH